MADDDRTEDQVNEGVIDGVISADIPPHQPVPYLFRLTGAFSMPVIDHLVAEMAAIDPAAPDVDRLIAAAYQDRIDESLEQIKKTLTSMRGDQEEINELKAETRALLRKLRVA